MLEGCQVDLVDQMRMQIYRNHKLSDSFLWLNKKAETGRRPSPATTRGTPADAAVLLSVAVIEMDKAAFQRGDMQKVEAVASSTFYLPPFHPSSGPLLANFPVVLSHPSMHTYKSKVWSFATYNL